MKNLIYGVVIGITFTLVAYLTYAVFSMQKVVAEDHGAVVQIVNLIKASQQKTQSVAPTTK